MPCTPIKVEFGLLLPTQIRRNITCIWKKQNRLLISLFFTPIPVRLPVAGKIMITACTSECRLKAVHLFI